MAQIGDLHSRSLNNVDDAAAQRNAAQLEELVGDTSALSATLKKRVKGLEAQKGSGRDGQIRLQQVGFTMYKSVFISSWGSLDCSCEVEVRGSYSELPVCRATIPNEIQTKNGEAIQNW